MTERDKDIKDPRAISFGSEIAHAAFLSTAVGSVSYGVTRVLTDGDLDKKIGLSFGGFLASSHLGLSFGEKSFARANLHEIEGNHGRAMLNVLRSGIETTIGFGTGIAIPAYQATEVKGALIVGALSGLAGARYVYSLAKDMRHVGKAYREAIIPARNPSNFPGRRVIEHSAYENNALGDCPPVYRAYTFDDMAGFRKDQEDRLRAQASSLSGRYASLVPLLTKLGDAIFVIPNIVHLPNDEGFSESQPIELIDVEGNTLDVAYERKLRDTWSRPKTLQDPSPAVFGQSQWDEIKDAAWERKVVLLAKRCVETTQDTNEIITMSKYYLIDVLND